jgi:hypothetical protein
MAGNKNSGRQKNPPKARELLKKVIPIKDMFNEDEIIIYESLIDIYLKDFDEDDLTSSDIDDLMTLATNKIMEIRILTDSKGSPEKQLDISNAIEKLRKQSDKIKENLSARRKDRIDPNEFKGFSIIDLAIAFDDIKKLEMENRARKLKKEQDELVVNLDSYGNKNDIDSVSSKK